MSAVLTQPAIPAEVRAWQLINLARQRSGATSLALSPTLCRLCQHHGVDFIYNGYFGVNAPDGITPIHRLEHAPYLYTSGVVFVLRSFNPTPEFAVGHWLKRHGEDLLNRDYHGLGIARIKKRLRTHWVLYMTGYLL